MWNPAYVIMVMLKGKKTNKKRTVKKSKKRVVLQKWQNETLKHISRMETYCHGFISDVVQAFPYVKTLCVQLGFTAS